MVPGRASQGVLSSLLTATVATAESLFLRVKGQGQRAVNWILYSTFWWWIATITCSRPCHSSASVVTCVTSDLQDSGSVVQQQWKFLIWLMEKINYIQINAFLRNVHSKEECDTEEGPIHAEIIYKLGTESSLCQVPDRSSVSASSSTCTVCYTNKGNQSGRIQAGYFGTLRKGWQIKHKQINLYRYCNKSGRQVETRPGWTPA